MQAAQAAEPCPDDPTISDDADLWRRIHPNWWVQERKTGRWRVSSQAFKDSSDNTPMSVILAAPGRDPMSALATFPDHGLASFKARCTPQLAGVLPACDFEKMLGTQFKPPMYPPGFPDRCCRGGPPDLRGR